MKQIVQDLRAGSTVLEEVPTPQVRRGAVLIKTTRTLVSLGTERMLVEFGKANLFQKARQQPDKVKQVLDKIKAEGLKPTLEAVFRKLNEPIPLGYCNVGEVIAVGEGVSEIKIGDRVASNGNHAEIVCVPKNLVAKIPDNVSDDDASFTVIGAIALQGIRLINPTFGETIVVSGLGLIGLIGVQLLRANGCRVIGLDFDQKKVDLAKALGVEAYNLAEGTDPVALVEGLTNGIGADAVLITASTKSDELIHQAANMSRQRGRIVLVGVIGLDLQRADFYEKELTFQVSCSYGPGRYDEEYEQKGNDYPIAFVRWTEQRNFEAVLHAISSGMVNVKPLITEVVDLEQYDVIYGDIAKSRAIASIIRYSGAASPQQTTVQISQRAFAGQKGVLGVIGAGNFAKGLIVPMLKKLDAPIKSISSSAGLSGTLTAKKFGIPFSTTNNSDIINDPEIDAVLITTRHNSHASLVLQALQAGKHVFVEKPLAITHEEIDSIVEAYQAQDKTLTVGFNRRFSPFVAEAKKRLGANVPMTVTCTLNAGFLPLDNWNHDMNTGGGRIIGEACHLIDLIAYLTDSQVERVVMTALGPDAPENSDIASMLLQYKNGSIGVVNYFANGNKAYSKERVEVYSQGRTLVIDNFRRAHFYGFKGKGSMSGAIDKGHKEQFRLFMERLRTGGQATIPFDSLINTSRTAIAAVESLQAGAWVNVR